MSVWEKIQLCLGPETNVLGFRLRVEGVESTWAPKVGKTIAQNP